MQVCTYSIHTTVDLVIFNGYKIHTGKFRCWKISYAAQLAQYINMEKGNISYSKFSMPHCYTKITIT